ncbi:histidine phosphatase family protein [Sphingomonas oligoaromativorans]|uniref:histidine phosphatase family protein n=1 Tax=Sphingomonas oligoaromativorans TaxID=575322 RepID=UPI00142359F2|nr:histidine phosphatase family protein [Sphingomonas oligoaromativorans]NIJ31933.1 putative phosphoglycerate mutase [Sphingomonas oligoaromativorans]
MSARFTIVRHGNTFAPGEPARRVGLRTDIPLVESGREQGRALGRAFAGRSFDRILASPLLRTRETAELIASALASPPPIETADWLAEIDHGPDENQPEAAILARIGADALAAWEREAIVPPGWEIDVPARLAAWRRLYDGASDAILLVTSNGAARFALTADAALRAQAEALPTLKLRTGAWGEIAATDAGLRLEAWDRRP